jgi:hypothetical protein
VMELTHWWLNSCSNKILMNNISHGFNFFQFWAF